jgi:hypothetical protein
MSKQPPKEIRIIVPCGSLGAGVREREIEYALEQGAQAIASDAGSTDSGAAYLARGMSKNSREAVKRDLKVLMKAQATAKIPILIGSCGQAGGDAGVEWTRDIAVEIARELGVTPRIALLKSELDHKQLKGLNAQGAVKPLPPLGALTDDVVESCDHIVAVMGPEPFIAALEAGADIVLGGRTTDTAVIAAYPLMRGASPGPSWHAGKISECGAQCAELRNKGAGVLLRIQPDAFEVEPLALDNFCSPHSVSAHMLYENSDPFRLVEPGGVLDVTNAKYHQADARSVRVEGSAWETAPYTMKLEGAGTGWYQTIMLVGVRDPEALANLNSFHDKMLASLIARSGRAISADPCDYSISLRIYGWNAVTGERVPEDTPPPREVGVLFVATAKTQALATEVAKACNPAFFHFSFNPEVEMPSYAFPFSPADVERGAVYEFKLNHVVEVADPMSLVRTEWVDLKRTEAA